MLTYLHRRLFRSLRPQPSPQPPSNPVANSVEEARSAEVSRHIDTLTRFIERYSDQKLCDVLAFCEDGRMNYRLFCNCLLGVFSSSVLHVQACTHDTDPPHHYHRLKLLDPLAAPAESAYHWLGEQGEDRSLEQQHRRDCYLMEVLRMELTRRGRLRRISVRLEMDHPSCSGALLGAD
jgi:hypothetical protein